MVTVPAHNFCAPARAKLIAALRSMPGVDGTLGSSWSPGMTRTPSCFQRSRSCECVPVMMSLFDNRCRRKLPKPWLADQPAEEHLTRLGLVPPKSITHQGEFQWVA